MSQKDETGVVCQKLVLELGHGDCFGLGEVEGELLA